MAVSTRKRPALIRGHQMFCPRCKKYHDILAYKPMQVIPDYAADTVPIYACPECRWKFAPSPSTVQGVVLTAEDFPT
jgi:hypothetical protein